jgi:hypothetical protein
MLTSPEAIAADRLDLIRQFLRAAETGQISEASRGAGEDIKICRPANILVGKCGADALTVAEQRTAEMSNRSDAENSPSEDLASPDRRRSGFRCFSSDTPNNSSAVRHRSGNRDGSFVRYCLKEAFFAMAEIGFGPGNAVFARFPC